MLDLHIFICFIRQHAARIICAILYTSCPDWRSTPHRSVIHIYFWAYIFSSLLIVADVFFTYKREVVNFANLGRIKSDLQLSTAGVGLYYLKTDGCGGSLKVVKKHTADLQTNESAAVTQGWVAALSLIWRDAPHAAGWNLSKINKFWKKDVTGLPPLKNEPPLWFQFELHILHVRGGGFGSQFHFAH